MHNGVHIRVEGLVLEKLLDRAVESGISFLSIERRSPHDMELWLDDRNARRFLALAERFSYRAVVLERRGSSAVRVRMRARWSVLVGLCVAVLMLWAFSTRIWRIDIEVEESRHAPIASIETALQNWVSFQALPRRRLMLTRLRRSSMSVREVFRLLA